MDNVDKYQNNLLFTSIYIKDENFKDYNFDSNADFIENLSQLNIFIGINNSGKSRFIRKLFNHEELKFLSPALNVKEIKLVLR